MKIDSPTHQIQMTMLPCWMKQRRMGVWICWVGLAGEWTWTWRGGMHVARHLLLATLRGPAHSCYSVALSGPLFSSIYHAYSYILGLWIYSEGICMACEFTVKEWSRWIISCAKHFSVRVVAALQMPARIDRSIRSWGQGWHWQRQTTCGSGSLRPLFVFTLVHIWVFRLACMPAFSSSTTTLSVSKRM